MHAVFDVGTNSRYRKDFWHRYEIPNKGAADAARACIGDWVIFRQTGVEGYIAVARVEDVVPDLERPGHSVALIGDYLPFPSTVPFHKLGRYAEHQLRVIGRSLRIGQAIQGKPIRELILSDFLAITLGGFSRTMKISGDRLAIAREPNGFDERADALWDYEPTPRTIQEILVRRAFRDANFRLEVCTPYRNLCAFTKLSMTDGKLFDVEAVYIWPVSNHGPDIIQNALCSSKLFHWPFDRYLISIGEDYCPIVAPGAIPKQYLALLPPPGEPIHLPQDMALWPSKVFLDHHRAIFTKKNGL